ncbi:phosphohistidine phosphatase SixA [Vibrio zhanjiangensis]|uniref:Phosphohistidine phosphatase SixA n=1 Tax=Vibrio zhanjiangensis TaxID=1046128 RepID=A0ABQ6EWG2_9VIBR|nr:phosphohistidine phosphatase SixA [Vibrio zhanjiangensis]GLT17406.1 phosphohistidine phosphatase SixA [Vibrio zhanjiangensis]
MKILIMRHGEAEHYANSDAERALTKKGKQESIEAVKQCVENGYTHLDLVLVSPYLRAQQTWQAVASHFCAKQIKVCDDITPYGDAGRVGDYISAIAEVEQPTSILLVSHLPLVGYLTSELVPELAPPMFPTSGIVGIEYDIERRKGELVLNIRP